MYSRLLLFLLLTLNVCFVNAQDEDIELRDFADKKIPASICCGIVSFRLTMIHINEVIALPDNGLDIKDDSVTATRFRIRLNYNAKDIDTVAQYFDLPEGESWYNAKVNMMEVHFKTKAFKGAYLKKLGTAILPGKRWGFWMNKNDCKGVQIYNEAGNIVRLVLITGCGAG